MQNRYETLNDVMEGLTKLPDGPRGSVAVASEFLLAASVDTDHSPGMRSAMLELGWSLCRVGEAMDAMGDVVGGAIRGGRGDSPCRPA